MSNELGDAPSGIQFERLTHNFGSRKALHEHSGVFLPAGINVITGPNGAGKSTLLRILAGLLQPSSGSIEFRWHGQVFDSAERRKWIGYAAPDLMLYRELTGAENLQFFGELRGISLSREQLITQLTRVGLRGRGRDSVSGYSSGMRQRLKLAYALLGDPPVIMLDEPTANLDSEGRSLVEGLVCGWREDPNRLVLLATNEPAEVAWGDTIFPLGVQNITSDTSEQCERPAPE